MITKNEAKERVEKFFIENEGRFICVIYTGTNCDETLVPETNSRTEYSKVGEIRSKIYMLHQEYWGGIGAELERVNYCSPQSGGIVPALLEGVFVLRRTKSSVFRHIFPGFDIMCCGCFGCEFSTKKDTVLMCSDCFLDLGSLNCDAGSSLYGRLTACINLGDKEAAISYAKKIQNCGYHKNKGSTIRMQEWYDVYKDAFRKRMKRWTK